MEVILLERIDNLGQMGEVVKVRAGYARNYLLPQKKALRATEENKKHFETRRAQLEAANLERRSEAEKLAEKLNGLTVVIVRQAGDAGQLYGSVNARDIATAITAVGVTVNRQQVGLQNPIKALGLYPVNIALHPELSVSVTANVARSEDEAKVQAKTGKAVVTGVAEEGAAPAKAKEAKVEDAAEVAAKFFEEGAAPKADDEDDGGDKPGAEAKDATAKAAADDRADDGGDDRDDGKPAKKGKKKK